MSQEMLQLCAPPALTSGELFDRRVRPNTPIAGRVFDHFASDGNIADAVRLVESLERSSTAGVRAVVPASAKSRPKELPPDWAPTALDLKFARDEGLADEAIRREIGKFRDYWPNAPGARRKKVDWSATWRNWIRKAADELNKSRGMRNGTYRNGGGFALNDLEFERRAAHQGWRGDHP
jgi:hypothetical protein